MIFYNTKDKSRKNYLWKLILRRVKILSKNLLFSRLRIRIRENYRIWIQGVRKSRIFPDRGGIDIDILLKHYCIREVLSTLTSEWRNIQCFGVSSLIHGFRSNGNEATELNEVSFLNRPLGCRESHFNFKKNQKRSQNCFFGVVFVFVYYIIISWLLISNFDCWVE